MVRFSRFCMLVCCLIVDTKNLCREAVMLPVLEISQVLFSSPSHEQLSIRPVVFADFVNVMESLQERASLEQ